MEFEVKCYACYETFITTRRDKKYCSKACSRRKIHWVDLKTLNCKFKNCNRLFDQHRKDQKYCSQTCANLDWCKSNRVVIPKSVFKGSREKVINNLIKFFDEKGDIPQE